MFYDYLIANLKLYFDKFERELATDVEEPTNQAYDDAKAEEEAPESDLGAPEADLGDLGDMGGEEEIRIRTLRKK